MHDGQPSPKIGLRLPKKWKAGNKERRTERTNRAEQAITNWIYGSHSLILQGSFGPGSDRVAEPRPALPACFEFRSFLSPTLWHFYSSLHQRRQGSIFHPLNASHETHLFQASLHQRMASGVNVFEDATNEDGHHRPLAAQIGK